MFPIKGSSGLSVIKSLNISLVRKSILVLKCGGRVMNMYVIAMYDINTETKAGQKRLRQIFKLLKKYLIRIQNSVFEGEITKAKFEEMKLNVNHIIDHTLDSVNFFKSRDIKWMDKDICGFEKDDTDNFL